MRRQVRGGEARAGLRPERGDGVGDGAVVELGAAAGGNLLEGMREGGVAEDLPSARGAAAVREDLVESAGGIGVPEEGPNTGLG